MRPASTPPVARGTPQASGEAGGCIWKDAGKNWVHVHDALLLGLAHLGEQLESKLPAAKDGEQKRDDAFHGVVPALDEGEQAHNQADDAANEESRGEEEAGHLGHRLGLTLRATAQDRPVGVGAKLFASHPGQVFNVRAVLLGHAIHAPLMNGVVAADFPAALVELALQCCLAACHFDGTGQGQFRRGIDGLFHAHPL